MAKMVKKILFLAANPGATSRLSLDQEAKEIRQGLERARGRDSFEIATRWAVDADELRRSLLDIEPHIVHFSGHGTGADGLVLHAGEGKAKLAGDQALANLFGLFAGQIECVLLNACYSEVQAKAIYQHVNCVIGMNQAVGDRTAIKFAVGFYDALGAGRPYENAYRFGCSAIDFEDMVQRLTPVLMTRQPEADESTAEPNGQIAYEPDCETEDEPEATGVILENPEGQVPLNSPFYVERSPAETDCYAAVVKSGALIRVKAAILNWESNDEPEHLRTIRDRLLRDEQKAARRISLYQRILQEDGLPVETTNPAHIELRLSGAVVERNRQLHVYDPIYAAIFNLP